MGITTTVRDIMTRDIISVETSDSVKKAIDLMVKKDIGSVIVTKNGEPVGIVTVRDIMRNVCPEELCTSGIEAGKIMRSPLITVPADAKLGIAASLMMEKGVRRLVVEENGKAIGIVTHRDLIKGTMDTFMALAMV
ncbi:MAG: CBS domain-containing protein [Candidatus Bathyarchaeia archaeon]|jgi:CBS domain-containing protein